MILEYLNACEAWFISWGMRDSWIICVWSWKFRFPEVSPTMTDSKRDAWILLKFVREMGSRSPLLTPSTWFSGVTFWRTIGWHFSICSLGLHKNTQQLDLSSALGRTLHRNLFCYPDLHRPKRRQIPLFRLALDTTGWSWAERKSCFAISLTSSSSSRDKNKYDRLWFISIFYRIFFLLREDEDDGGDIGKHVFCSVFSST